MLEEKYIEKLQLAFYGSGGGIVKEYYEKALNDSRTLEDVINDIQHDVEEYLKEGEQAEECFENVLHLSDPASDDDRFMFLETFVGEDRCSYPELC